MQKIVPFLWFEKPLIEVVDFYTSIFKDIEVLEKKGFTEGSPFASATLRIHGQQFIVFNAGPFNKFSPATSFFINCDTQEEVDYLWDKLSAGGKLNRCGWLDDQFGVTWQVVPVQLGQLLNNPDRQKAGRVMQAMMKMDKIIIADLEKAAQG